MKLLKLLETSHCLSVSVYGIISDSIKVPVCFRNVPGKTFATMYGCGYSGEAVQLCSRTSECCDKEIPGSLPV